MARPAKDTKKRQQATEIPFIYEETPSKVIVRRAKPDARGKNVVIAHILPDTGIIKYITTLYLPAEQRALLRQKADELHTQTKELSTF